MKPETTIAAFGLYLVLAGLGLMLIPSPILGLVGLQTVDDGWVRVLGMAASALGVYYLLAVRFGLSEFYRWTVPVRVYATVVMIMLVVFGKIGPGLLVFAAAEGTAALWTWLALRSDSTGSAA